ncbi:Uncharacterised protein [[Pasteurella] mairii]|uniref:Uncharacterized protein n=1 Tax=[Pasteurella] mairii TaxID=757 RepID=A0A379B043_9PAST|nr:Uncharacterised protein [[Pasteurella] mairii]
MAQFIPQRWQKFLAEDIKGILQPEQLAQIPTTKLSGQLSDGQIAGISAVKIRGMLNIATLPSIPTKKLTGTLSATQIAANAVGTNHLAANAVNADKLAANSVTAAKNCCQ